MSKPWQWPLHAQIFLALVLAFPTGFYLTSGAVDLSPLLSFFGTLFLNALKMLVVPLVLLAIIDGLLSMDSQQNFKSLGLKTLAYYSLTSLIAILIGLLLVNLFTPGLQGGEPVKDLMGLSPLPESTVAAVSGKSGSDLWGVFLRMIPTNIFKTAAEGQILGLITFGFLFGIFAHQLPESPRHSIKQGVSTLNQLFMKMTEGIMKMAPIGIWGLVSMTISHTGFAAIRPLGTFVLVVVLGLSLHALGALSVFLVLAKVSPRRHLKGMSSALLTAFSTSSSAATLPRTLECLDKNAGVSKRIRAFILPLGATVNMDGTALYECVAALFIAQAYGIELDFVTQFTVVVVALLSSIGVAAIPSASLVAIVLILQTIHLPLEGLGLILASDRLLDMFRTAVNVYSDSVGAVVLAKLEGENPYGDFARNE